jgi:hypothetical protein
MTGSINESGDRRIHGDGEVGDLRRRLVQPTGLLVDGIVLITFGRNLALQASGAEIVPPPARNCSASPSSNSTRRIAVERTSVGITRARVGGARERLNAY